MSLLTILLLLAFLGIFSGILAGLLGVGGGLILVPFLTYVMHQQGVPQAHIVHSAIATSLAIILFTSISSMRAHHKAQAILWSVFKFITPGLLIGGLLGSKIATYIPTTELALIFGAFVIFSALQLYADKRPKSTRQLPKPFGLISVGSGIGCASSLVGAGGGFLSVPFMVWCNVPLRNAVATSSALGFPIALFSTVGYIAHGIHLTNMPNDFIGYIYWPAVASVSAVSMCTAPIGAKLAHTLPVRKIKRIFAFLLAGIALSMIYKAISGF
jgi:uncharacterized membrane protein YfcA